MNQSFHSEMELRRDKALAVGGEKRPKGGREQDVEQAVLAIQMKSYEEFLEAQKALDLTYDVLAKPCLSLCSFNLHKNLKLFNRVKLSMCY
ncbi:MAG: hypothetical protein WC966_11380 [Bradymonadales bacterium]|jgi:hypothetical protein